MSFFDDIKMNKSLKSAQIFISYEKNNPVLYVGNGENKLLLKRFFGIKQYQRFLTEAVLCHMYADRKYLKQIKKAYCRLVDFLEFPRDDGTL